MARHDSVGERTGDTTAEFQGSGKATGVENVTNSMAETLQEAAKGLGEKAAEQDAHSGIAQYGKQASDWLDQSAEYVRQFNYAQANARVRDYVKQSPGRSLLLAGTVGLVIGALLRRR